MRKKISKLVMALAVISCLGLPRAFAADTAAPAAPSAPATTAPAAAPTDASVPFVDSTPDEAMAWSKRAAEYVRAHGAAAATAAFNDPHGQFVKNDLYVFVVDDKGVFLAHPIKPAMVGVNMMDMKDVDGTPLVKLFTEVKDEAWVAYKWPHPVTKKIRPKKSYIINIKGIPGGYFVGVGTYYEDKK